MSWAVVEEHVFLLLFTVASFLQVKNQRENLLSHPLVNFLLDYKWKKFGRFIYYLKLALFCIFLFFLTGYTVYYTENAPVCNATNNKAQGNADKSSAPYILWISVGRIVILALASWHILSEVGYCDVLVYTSKCLFTIKAKVVYLRLQTSIYNIENRIFANLL